MRGQPGSGSCGTQAHYVGGCRCQSCKTAHADYARAYRRREVPCGYVPVESVLPLVRFLVRRYGSLIAAEQAAGFGSSGSRFSAWQTGRYRLVQKASAERLAAFVLAHRRRVPVEPWAVFDTDAPRPSTAFERERARGEAERRYRDEQPCTDHARRFCSRCNYYPAGHVHPLEEGDRERLAKQVQRAKERTHSNPTVAPGKGTNRGGT